MPDFVKACRQQNIKPIGGIEFKNGDELLYIGIARNNDGFEQLNRFLSNHLLSNEPLPQRAPELYPGIFYLSFRAIYPITPQRL